MKRLRFAIEALLFAALLRVGALLPRRALHALGAATGLFASVVDRRHTRIARNNLRLAFGGGLSEREERRIVRECWKHFGRITFDSLAFPRLSARDIGTVVRVEGAERVRSAYERGKGVLFFSGHMGHWEIAALAQGFAGHRMLLVARPLDNPHLERMLARLRTLSGNIVIHKRSAVREILRALREGLGAAIVIDQDARNEGIFVPFFGIPAATTPTLALLALRTGAPIIPVFAYPGPRGTWRVVYDPEVPVEPTGDREADVARITAACTAVIERQVRAHPEQWLWMHRRWKTQPREGER